MPSESTEIQTAHLDAVAAHEPVAGLTEHVAFEIGDRHLALSVIERESAWHRREGTLYGWVRSGTGRLEYGDDDEPLEVEVTAGDFLRIPTGTVCRFLADERLEVVAVSDGGHDTSETAASTTRAAPEVVGADELVPTVESPNLRRETPFPDAEVLVLQVTAAGGAAAGWHHHGDNVYFGYAVDGPSETEYGPTGEAVARIGIGDCFHVPPRMVHRDTNPTSETHTGIIWLCDGPPWVVNVGGPR